MGIRIPSEGIPSEGHQSRHRVPQHCYRHGEFASTGYRSIAACGTPVATLMCLSFELPLSRRVSRFSLLGPDLGGPRGFFGKVEIFRIKSTGLL